MDAFSGYNQIMMQSDDREKTMFITDRGTYCYKVMPFGLKNEGAMFAEQLGHSMEVYIDDMLVKLLEAKEHVGHLKKCFKILNHYDMKLNSAKCTFAVTSGEFLGYIVIPRGIEVNPKQIATISSSLLRKILAKFSDLQVASPHSIDSSPDPPKSVYHFTSCYEGTNTSNGMQNAKKLSNSSNNIYLHHRS